MFFVSWYGISKREREKKKETKRERECENGLWEEKSILRVTEMRSGLGLRRGKNR